MGDRIWEGRGWIIVRGGWRNKHEIIKNSKEEIIKKIARKLIIRRKRLLRYLRQFSRWKLRWVKLLRWRRKRYGIITEWKAKNCGYVLRIRK